MPPKPPCIWRAAIVARMLRESRGEHLGHRSCPRRRSARSSVLRRSPCVPAGTECAAPRQDPRLERPERAADCNRTLRSRSRRPLSLRVVTAPATRSEWPLRYLVAECITRSAPSSRVASAQARRGLSRRRAGPLRVRELGGGGDVGDRPEGIRRRLDPDKAWSCPAAPAASSTSGAAGAASCSTVQLAESRPAPSALVLRTCQTRGESAFACSAPRTTPDRPLFDVADVQVCGAADANGRLSPGRRQAHSRNKSAWPDAACPSGGLRQGDPRS